MADSMNAPTLQIVLREGMLDLGWGHPDADLLPVAAIGRASAAAHAKYADVMYQYGWPAGPAALIERLQARILRDEGKAPDLSEICLTAGNSWALDQVLTLCAPPQSVILVENPTYHYAVKIMRDHANPLAAVQCDADGLDLEDLQKVMSAQHALGRSVACLYLVPTFNNPTGRCMPLARRQALLEIAARAGLLIIEDDVYRELAFDAAPPPSLWSLDQHGVVIRLASFSKSLAPGLRSGYVTGAQANINKLADGGVLDSGGGIMHHTAFTLAELDVTGELDAAAAHLRRHYRARRDALVAALHEQLSPDYTVHVPGGGFFVWLSCPLPARSLLPLAEAAGVSFIPGERFYLDGGGSHNLRLSFSLYAPDALREAARRLGVAARVARQ